MTVQADAQVVADFGAWKSPITAEFIAESTVRLGDVILDGSSIYLIEMRPREQGRYVLVRLQEDGTAADVLPAPYNVRTRAHEYGGGASLIDDGVVYFTHYPDQRIYRHRVGDSRPPAPITPEVEDGGWRFADMLMDRGRQRLIAVREDHEVPGDEPENTIVAIPLAGDGAHRQPPPADGGIRVLTRGYDFYSSPRLSPDGTRLAWMAWRHPNMPWDGSELWVADLTENGGLAEPRLIAGGPRESIFQPEWSPAGDLCFVSDRSGFWNLYRWRGAPANGDAAAIVPLCPRNADFGAPQWGFGMATYGFAAGGRIACAFTEGGTWYMATLDPESGRLAALDMLYTEVSMHSGFRVSGNRAAFVAGSPTEFECVVSLDLATGATRVLRRSTEVRVDPGYLSVPQAIEFPTTGNRTAHAFYYAPRNRDYRGPEGALPPLIVMSHGGPTSSSCNTLELKIQYWTSRGFAVADVNYGGSSGYGRAYRERLRGEWGVVDVDDCVNAARYLAARGDVDGAKLAITGGSAGGYTTLSALAYRNVFKAGASHYGVSDLEKLALDTHKFESRYLESLIGPYPARKDLYRERSPLHAADRINCPVIFFQGLEDVIVHPSQAEMMVEALKRRGVPVAYLPFPGEQHGFRRGENVIRSLTGELYFYSKVFGFTPADAIEPVPIENLPPN